MVNWQSLSAELKTLLSEHPHLNRAVESFWTTATDQVPQDQSASSEHHQDVRAAINEANVAMEGKRDPAPEVKEVDPDPSQLEIRSESPMQVEEVTPAPAEHPTSEEQTVEPQAPPTEEKEKD